MKQWKIILLAIIAVGLAACSDDDNNDAVSVAPTNTANEPIVEPTPEEKVLVADGETQMQADISGFRVYTIGGATTLTSDDIYADHPVLAKQVDTLKAITNVRLSSLNTLELYVGEKLVILLGRANDQAPWTVQDSLMGFTVDVINYTPPTLNEEPEVSIPIDGILSFGFAECIPEKATNCPPAYVDMFLRQTGLNVGDETEHDVTEDGTPTGR